MTTRTITIEVTEQEINSLALATLEEEFGLRQTRLLSLLRKIAPDDPAVRFLDSHAFEPEQPVTDDRLTIESRKIGEEHDAPTEWSDDQVTEVGKRGPR